MSEEIYDGGPAFPQPTDRQCDSNPYNMSLRDYFAAQALKSILITYSIPMGDDTTDAMIDRRTTMAYRIADSMLRASQK
jgi:hypothetical protein